MIEFLHPLTDNVLLAIDKLPDGIERRAGEVAREHMQQAQREAEAARGLLALEQKAREAAEETAREARERAARERTAREAAERTTKEIRDQAAKERARRLRARQASESPSPSWVYSW